MPVTTLPQAVHICASSMGSCSAEETCHLFAVSALPGVSQVLTGHQPNLQMVHRGRCGHAGGGSAATEEPVRCGGRGPVQAADRRAVRAPCGAPGCHAAGQWHSDGQLQAGASSLSALQTLFRNSNHAQHGPFLAATSSTVAANHVARRHSAIHGH